MSSGLIKYRPDIDGLRAIAVLAVVIFHMTPTFLPGGFVGVDVFFVISGYLISSIILRQASSNTFTLKDFYIRRVKRIFPTLILVLLSTWILGFCFLLKDEFRNLGKHIYSGAFFFANITLWKESGYFDAASETKPLLHLWSLSIEEQFYIFWPLILVWIVRKRWNPTSSLLIIISISFFLNLILVETHFVSTFYLLHTRSWELLAGALLSSIEFKHSVKLSEKLKDFTSVLGLAFVCIPFVLFSGSDLFPGWRAIFPVLGSFLLILSGPSALVNKHFLSLKLMVAIGLISYPLYLWHWPLLSFATILDSNETVKFLRVSLVFVSFFLSWLTYKFLEQPIRFNIPKNREARYSLYIAGLLFLVGVLGILTKNQKNWQILSSGKVEALFRIPVYTNSKCTERYPVQNDAYCFDSSDEPRLVIIGDSHSLALRPGLEKNSSIIHFGRGSCPPLLDTIVKAKGEKDYCSEVMRDAYQRIKGIGSIQTVVLVARWNAYLDSDEVYEFRNDESQDREAVLTTGLEKTIQQILSSGKRVVFVHAVPDLSFDPKACEKLRFLQLSSLENSCFVTLKNVQENQRKYRTFVQKVLAKFPEVRVFEPMDFLCDEINCYAKKGDTLLYRDETHLSILGAESLGVHWNLK